MEYGTSLEVKTRAEQIEAARVVVEKHLAAYNARREEFYKATGGDYDADWVQELQDLLGQLNAAELRLAELQL